MNGKWAFPDTLTIFQKYQANNPAFSADGKNMFFHSQMSLEKDGTFKDNDLWFVKKTENGWSEPENLGPNVNSLYNELRPSVAQNGNIYFSVNHDIYRSVYKNGQYQPREKLKAPLNDGLGNASPYIAPDEGFIIFESIRPGGFSFVNLYICFKENDDSWSQPIIMGEDICKGNARFPGAISPDGNYFFFTIDLDYYWVDAEIINQLNPSGHSRPDKEQLNR
nr:PD40 domain-containing protein [Bacteroidota bacterium]